MGNAAFWYQPRGQTHVTKIDLLRRLRERQGPTPVYRGEASEAMGGIVSTRIHNGRSVLQVGLTFERSLSSGGADSNSQLKRKLYGLVAHLKRGGICQLVEDTAHAWAAFTDRPFGFGDTTISYSEPVLTYKINPGYSPDDREIYIESDPDSYLTEERLVTAVGAGYVTIDATVQEDYTGVRWALLRESGYYPALRVPLELRTQPMLTHRENRVFFLDVPLETDAGELERLALLGGAMAGETEGPEGASQSPFDLDDFDQMPDLDRYRW